MRQSAPTSAGPKRHDAARLSVGPICLPASGMTDQDVPTNHPPAARHAPAQVPAASPAMPHPLEPLAARAAWLLRDCTVSLIPGCDGPAMLMVERLSADGASASHTWLLTPISATTLELETMVGDTRLELVAEGPPDRVLAWLWRLNLRAARAAARRAR